MVNTTKIFDLDYVKKEYYILDRYKGEVKRIKNNMKDSDNNKSVNYKKKNKI